MKPVYVWFRHHDGELDGPFNARGTINPDGTAIIHINGQWFHGVSMMGDEPFGEDEIIRWSFVSYDRYNRAEVL